MAPRQTSGTSQPTKNTNYHINTPTQVLLVVLSLAGVYLYGKFLLNPANAGDLIPYIMAVAAESFILFHAVMTVWTIVVGGYNPRNFDYYRTQATMVPAPYRQRQLVDGKPQMVAPPQAIPLYIKGSQAVIDVYVTVYGEPPEVVEKTIIAARDIMGRHNTYVLDDGESDIIKELCREHGVGYIRRPNHNHAKAGNINYALRKTQGEFFVIFDADFVPKPNFLHETLPFFNDPLVAFVQTPQVYRNFDTAISRGAGYMQSIFYKLVMPGKNRFNSAFCVGTNVIFRRSAILSIGGMYTKSKSEDIWTSLKLHEQGYKSIFISDELAIGETPETIKAFSKQQIRWATGGLEMFLWHNPLFIKQLSIDQRIQYFATSSYYLLGFATALLMVLPPLQIFFNVTPVNLHIPFLTWLFFYLSFYGMQIATAFYSMNGFRFEVMMLATISFPLYLQAFWDALRGKSRHWNATGDRSGFDSPYNYIVVHMLIFVFLVFASVMGVIKYFEQGSASLSLVWNTINVAVFASYLWIARSEHRKMVAARKRQRSTAKNYFVSTPALGGAHE